MQFDDDKICELLKTRGLHFCHLNVNTLLSKIDELRDITNYIKPEILGSTESTLNSSVTNAEVNINGYGIIRNDRNRNGGSAACYISSDLCFNVKNIFSNFIEDLPPYRMSPSLSPSPPPLKVVGVSALLTLFLSAEKSDHNIYRKIAIYFRIIYKSESSTNEEE